MPQRILALDIGTHEVRAAAIESTFRDYRVTGLYADGSDGATSLAERLRNFLARHNLEADTVLVTIPSELATQHRVLSFERPLGRIASTAKATRSANDRRTI